MLFEAWQQSSMTGCAPAALVAAWPSIALYGEGTAQYWHACREAVCRGCGRVSVVVCAGVSWQDLAKRTIKQHL